MLYLLSHRHWQQHPQIEQGSARLDCAKNNIDENIKCTAHSNTNEFDTIQAIMSGYD